MARFLECRPLEPSETGLGGLLPSPTNKHLWRVITKTHEIATEKHEERYEMALGAYQQAGKAGYSKAEPQRSLLPKQLNVYIESPISKWPPRPVNFRLRQAFMRDIREKHPDFAKGESDEIPPGWQPIPSSNEITREALRDILREMSVPEIRGALKARGIEVEKDYLRTVLKERFDWKGTRGSVRPSKA
jgi:hypothetical protein